MVKDLSYIHDLPSEALEEAIKQAVEEQCLKAISNYLIEVADTMETNKIESLSADALRAMAAQFDHRLKELTNDQN
jgi:DNA-directed RNA polymerase subunit E'/Rpb7